MKKPLTLDDLAAMSRTEAEIKALAEAPAPKDSRPVTAASLTSTAEFKQAAKRAAEWAKNEAKYQEDCGGGPGIRLMTCEGPRDKCRHHAELWLRYVQSELHALRQHGTPLELCPNGCGRPHIVCWTAVPPVGRGN